MKAKQVDPALPFNELSYNNYPFLYQAGNFILLRSIKLPA
jgi:hypothetical protein